MVEGPGRLAGGTLGGVHQHVAEPGPDSFDDMYSDLFVRAFRSASAILRNSAASEDAAAETLARAYAHWPTISGYAPAWVTRVAANLALDNVRRHHVVVAQKATEQDRSLDRLIFEGQLTKLPRRQKEAIMLRYLLDLDETQTARVLGEFGETRSGW